MWTEQKIWLHQPDIFQNTGHTGIVVAKFLVEVTKVLFGLTRFLVTSARDLFTATRIVVVPYFMECLIGAIKSLLIVDLLEINCRLI